MKNDIILEIRKSEFKRSLNRTLTFKPHTPSRNDIDSKLTNEKQSKVFNVQCLALSDMKTSRKRLNLKTTSNFTTCIDIIY